MLSKGATVHVMAKPGMVVRVVRVIRVIRIIRIIRAIRFIRRVICY